MKEEMGAVLVFKNVDVEEAKKMRLQKTRRLIRTSAADREKSRKEKSSYLWRKYYVRGKDLNNCADMSLCGLSFSSYNNAGYRYNFSEELKNREDDMTYSLLVRTDGKLGIYQQISASKVTAFRYCSRYPSSSWSDWKTTDWIREERNYLNIISAGIVDHDESGRSVPSNFNSNRFLITKNYLTKLNFKI